MTRLLQVGQHGSLLLPVMMSPFTTWCILSSAARLAPSFPSFHLPCSDALEAGQAPHLQSSGFMHVGRCPDCRMSCPHS